MEGFGSVVESQESVQLLNAHSSNEKIVTWTLPLDNLWDGLQTMQVGQVIQSRSFTIIDPSTGQNSNWILQLYPRGMNQDDADHTTFAVLTTSSHVRTFSYVTQLFRNGQIIGLLVSGIGNATESEDGTRRGVLLGNAIEVLETIAPIGQPLLPLHLRCTIRAEFPPRRNFVDGVPN